MILPKLVLRTQVPLWLSHLSKASHRHLFIGVCQQSVRPHHLPRPFSRFRPFCAVVRSPLHPAALAFVSFGIVLVRVRVRVIYRTDTHIGYRKAVADSRRRARLWPWANLKKGTSEEHARALAEYIFTSLVFVLHPF